VRSPPNYYSLKREISTKLCIFNTEVYISFWIFKSLPFIPLLSDNFFLLIATPLHSQTSVTCNGKYLVLLVHQ
jgi:hypothetical protein